MRISVSPKQNNWFNSETVDDSDLTLEQNYNNQVQAGIINNHFGTGVLPSALTQHILFDSDLALGLLDGKAINVQAQPSDNSNGNQLEVELTHSAAAGKRKVKLLIIGLDFQNNLQYDRFTFDRNEVQFSTKHYKVILTILLNDFVGATTQSLNLGGRLVIREANPVSLSRDCVMIAQDIEPNIFFRDFFVSSGGTLANVLATALPNYNIDNLNIKTGYLQLRSLSENDVSSQVGQKFLASTNNIQKITLLLSVVNNSTPSNLVWTGDLLVSVYQLQSTVACSTDIAPQLAIEFDPSNIPLAQLSINYNSLLAQGVQLNTVPQPVDFIFSNTPVGSGLVIKPGNYYVITVKRAGSADTCQIQFAVGSNSSPDIRETLFNGSVWVDVPEESLWFQTMTDAAKVSDGQAYDAGHGVDIPKVKEDIYGITKDYCLNKIQFTRNDVYYALLQALTEESVPVQDERTGNNVNSQKQYVPGLTLLNINSLSNIQSVSDPLIVGTISDKNVKSNNSGTLSAAFHSYGMVENELVLKVITDSSDGYRYDQNIIELVSELVNGNLAGAKLIPNISNPSLYYRIAKAELLTMTYGDIDGDGEITNNDLLLAQKLSGANLNLMPTYAEYVAQSEFFVSDIFVNWQIYNGITLVASGVDGVLNPNPIDGTITNLQSTSASFNSITNLSNCTIVLSGSIASPGNNGTFKIVSLIDNNNITVQKLYYNSETILQIMRGDVSCDMVLDSTDIGYITDYIQATPPFPPTSTPANRIGTTFNAIKFVLEKYVDRADDYPALSANRPSLIHIKPDMYLDGYSGFAGQNLELSPLSFSVEKQLVWNESSVVSNANPKLVPAAFGYQTKPEDPVCNPPGVRVDEFPKKPDFDPGRNDIFIPNNLIVNYGGQIVRPDGYMMKMDFEVSTITLEIPVETFDTEHTVNLLTDFVADYSGSGFTRLGYRAMKFADCSFVQTDALYNNQVRFAVAVQSFSPQLEGLDPNCINGVIVDNKIGVSVDYSTGILTLNFSNLFKDPVQQTLNTKVEITVYLKKAGWNNAPIKVDAAKSKNILEVPTPTTVPTVCPDPSVIIIT